MKQWTDLGNGQWRLTITDETNPTAPPDVFKGTKEEITEKLADSRVHANRRINELRARVPAAPAVPQTPQGAPRPLTATERMQTVADIQNPATVDQGVTRILESVIGPIEDLKSDRAATREERAERAAVAATNAFLARTPDYNRTAYNNDLLVNYLKARRLDPSKVESYTQAFEALTAAGLLQAQAPDDETQTTETRTGTERTAPTPRPANSTTRSSTSIRSSDISGRAPEPSRVPRLKYTREQLANLSAAEYKRLMQTDRAELDRCEAYYAKPARRAS